MRKLKLLFAAAALFMCAGVQAQTWVPSEVGEGSYYIYNVGAKGYIVPGNNWGTRASINSQGGILTTFTADGSAYKISTNSAYSGKYLGADGYVDQTAIGWTFEPVEGEANVYKMKKADGKYLYADAGATTTSLGDDPGTDYAKWKLVTREARIADLEANASNDNPIDATFLLYNPNFDRESKTDMWTGGVSLGGNNENYCAEKFNTTFDVNQTVTDAPKGKYALAFQGFYRYGGHGMNPAGDARKNGTEVLNTKLYANDTEAPLMSILDETTAGGGATYDGIAYPNSMAEASTAFSKGLYSTSMDFTVDVNTIKVGVKKTVTVTNDWTIFDNARLTYYGPVVDFTIYQNNLKTQVDNAEALYGKIPTAAETSLKATVNTYNKDYDNVDDYVEAIAKVKEAVETYEVLVEPYAQAKALLAQATTLAAEYPNLTDFVSTTSQALEAYTTKANIDELNTKLTKAVAVLKTWVDLKAKAVGLVAVANDNATANSTLAGVITEQDNQVKSVTAADEDNLNKVTTAISALKAAMTTYVSEVNPVGDGAKFDCTFLMTNPDLSGFASGTPVADVPGWDSDYTDGNRQTMKNDDVACEKGNAFFEYWSGTAKADNKFALYNNVENLPEGTYTIECYALATANGVAGATTSAIYFYANDTQGSLVSADKLTKQTISFVNDATQDVKIGLKTLTGNQFRWMGIGYVELYKVPAQTYAVSEDAGWDNTQSGAGDVTLTRTIKSDGVNTLVLPFSMTQAEVEATFGAGSKVYVVKSFENDIIKFETYDGISANKPCLLVTNVAGSSYNIEGRTIVAGDPVANGTGVSMTGNYAATYSAPMGSYIFSNNLIYLVDSDVSLKATRAYITVSDPSTARTLTFNLGDETTGVITLEGGELKMEKGAIYDLSGRRVLNPAKGIYLINGKKVVK